MDTEVIQNTQCLNDPKNKKDTTVRHASKRLCLARKRFRCVVKPHSEISYAPSGLQSTVFSQNQYIYISFFNLFLLHRRIRLCGPTALKSRVRPSPPSWPPSFVYTKKKKEKEPLKGKGQSLITHLELRGTNLTRNKDHVG